jgi:hypothetical protein
VRGALGPYLNVFLVTQQHWSQSEVGLMTTIGGLLGLSVQMPIGAVIDEIRAKRGVIVLALAVLALGVGRRARRVTHVERDDSRGCQRYGVDQCGHRSRKRGGRHRVSASGHVSERDTRSLKAVPRTRHACPRAARLHHDPYSQGHDRRGVVFGMAVTMVTWTSTDGKRILNAPAPIAAGTVVTLVWSIAIGTWVIFQ